MFPTRKKGSNEGENSSISDPMYTSLKGPSGWCVGASDRRIDQSAMLFLSLDLSV